ncbi:MAG: hypothetical protein ACLR0U_02270 [Enterocloster clostridioformis]
MEPSALKGKKDTFHAQHHLLMDMIEAMGGTPVPMAAGETYASLQQGIVDGAENTELAAYRGRSSGFGEILYIYRAPVFPGHLHHQHQELEPYDEGAAGLPGKGI